MSRSLSYRDVSKILNERGILIHQKTIMRWVHKYDHLIYQIWKKKNKKVELSWKVDKTYIKVKEKWCYCAINQEGYTLDIQLRKAKNYQAADMFMKKVVKAFGELTVLITTDKAPALLCAFKKLNHNGLYARTKHCTVKHFNNRIEQDHRHVKRCFAKSAGFQNLLHASRTLKRIESVHALYKQNRRLKLDSCFSRCNELQKLFIAT